MKFAPIIQEDCATIVSKLEGLLQQLAGKTVLITGASGFLCSYFVDCIVEWNQSNPSRSCRVIALDNNLTGSLLRLNHVQDNPNVLIAQHDIKKPLQIPERIDWIIHGASIASPMVYRKYPLETIDANVVGTRNVLEFALEKKSEGVVVMSSSEIYGDPDPAWIPTPEHYRGNVACLGPRACYDESKRMAETLSWTYWRMHGVNVRLIRPFNIYGPGFRLDDQRVLPDLFSAVLARRPIVMLSDGRPSRSFCYIADAICGILSVLFLGQGGEAYNVGNDESEIRMDALAKQVSETAADLFGGSASPILFRESPDTDYLTDNPQRRCPDLTKLRALANWSPTVPLVEGLRRTLTYYKQVGFAA